MMIKIKNKDGSQSKVSVSRGPHNWERRVDVTVYDANGYYKPTFSWTAILDVEDLERQLDLESNVTIYNNAGREIDRRIAIF